MSIFTDDRLNYPVNDRLPPSCISAPITKFETDSISSVKAITLWLLYRGKWSSGLILDSVSNKWVFICDKWRTRHGVCVFRSHLNAPAQRTVTRAVRRLIELGVGCTLLLAPPSPHPPSRSMEAHCSALASLLYSSSEECPVPPFQRLKTLPFFRRRHRALHPKTAGRNASRTPRYRVERFFSPPVLEDPSLVPETPVCCEYGAESECVWVFFFFSVWRVGPFQIDAVRVLFHSIPFDLILASREIAVRSSNHVS